MPCIRKSYQAIRKKWPVNLADGQKGRRKKTPFLPTVFFLPKSKDTSSFKKHYQFVYLNESDKIYLMITFNNNPISIKKCFSQKSYESAKNITPYIIIDDWIMPGGAENCRLFFLGSFSPLIILFLRPFFGRFLYGLCHTIWKFGTIFGGAEFGDPF